MVGDFRIQFSLRNAVISLFEIRRCMERCFANSGTSEGQSTEIGAEQAGHVDGGGGSAGGVSTGGQQDGARAVSIGLVETGVAESLTPSLVSHFPLKS